MAPKTKGKKVSQSTRAGLLFPVARLHNALKTAPIGASRVTKGASVYLASVIEYLVAELLELSGNAARDNQRTRITPRHILLAYMNDNELHALLRKCVLPNAGTLPNIPAQLLPKSSESLGSAAKGTKSRTTQKTTAAATPKTVTKKPTLTKKGTGSFSLLGTPTSKAAALKGTAITTLSERVLIRGQKLTVVQGSIVNIKADAIVHPTNNSFYMGGDVGKAIAKAGGQALRDAVAEAAENSTLTGSGEVALSTAPNLSASHLIHVHSPQWNAANQDQCITELDQATTNILTLADQQGFKSVALPSVSSGHAGFPKQTAAQTILAALSKYFRQNATTNLQQVFFVLYDPESVNVYTTELQRMVE